MEKKLRLGQKERTDPVVALGSTHKGRGLKKRETTGAEFLVKGKGTNMLKNKRTETVGEKDKGSNGFCGTQRWGMWVGKCRDRKNILQKGFRKGKSKAGGKGNPLGPTMDREGRKRELVWKDRSPEKEGEAKKLWWGAGRRTTQNCQRGKTRPVKGEEIERKKLWG